MVPLGRFVSLAIAVIDTPPLFIPTINDRSSSVNGPFPFCMKFEKIQNRQKYHHSLKERAMFSKIAKFGCEML